MNTKTSEAEQYSKDAQDAANSILLDGYYTKAEVDNKFEILIEKLQSLGIDV